MRIELELYTQEELALFAAFTLSLSDLKGKERDALVRNQASANDKMISDMQSVSKLNGRKFGLVKSDNQGESA